MNEGILPDTGSLHAKFLTQQCRDTGATDLMLACEGIARLIEGIPRFPCGSAGGMGF